jgi:hypothetical protein
MVKPSQPQLGFTLWIDHRPGLSIAAETEFSRRLEDYLTERELLMNGGPLRALIWSAERSLSATDQVDLLDWLIDDPVVRAVSLSPLSRRLDRPADRDAGALRAGATDLTLIALTLLYRSRRVSAEQYLRILGGFVRPAVAQ